MSIVNWVTVDLISDESKITQASFVIESHEFGTKNVAVLHQILDKHNSLILSQFLCSVVQIDAIIDKKTIHTNQTCLSCSLFVSTASM